MIDSLSDCLLQASERDKTRFNRNRGVVWDYKTACWCTPPEELSNPIEEALDFSKACPINKAEKGIQDEREEEASNPVSVPEAPEEEFYQGPIVDRIDLHVD